MATKNNKVLGIIFPNMHDEAIPELTRIRTMASVPFGGRYRMIDFALSGLVAAGVENICVVPRTSYVSLMDHVGSGKEWDLARKRGGLKIFPPYGEAGTKATQGRQGALEAIADYIESTPCEHVILADCGIRYARTIDSTGKFLPPDDPMMWHPTCHHGDEHIFELLQNFIDAQPTDGDLLFYLWGHSYEFDFNVWGNNWEHIEKVCSMIAGKEDIVYCTNIEFLNR